MHTYTSPTLSKTSLHSSRSLPACMSTPTPRPLMRPSGTKCRSRRESRQRQANATSAPLEPLVMNHAASPRASWRCPATAPTSSSQHMPPSSVPPRMHTRGASPICRLMRLAASSTFSLWRGPARMPPASEVSGEAVVDGVDGAIFGSHGAFDAVSVFKNSIAISLSRIVPTCLLSSPPPRARLSATPGSRSMPRLRAVSRA
mmetsp:Transcript_24476/g.68061  ORF Transcript_24476/g.68061 Transcript_24476/m.68061 type:complete len:202 (-) Transcript_24476:133-738(-)